MTMATTQQSLVVGVDVGGTFTDLFVLDEHRRGARDQGAVHARRGSARLHERHRPRGRGRRRHRHHRAWHHRRHQCAAGTQGGAHRHHHDGGLSRRAGDAPARPAADLPARRLRTRGAARPAAGGRRAGAGRRRDPHRGQRGPVEAAARELLARGCEAVCVFFVNAYANPERGPRGGAGARDLAQRPRHRRDRGVARDPRVRALLDRYAQRRPATGGGQLPDPAATGPAWPRLRRRAAGGAEQWRRDVSRNRLRRAGAHGAVRSGGRRHRLRRHRARRRPAGRGHGRHGRHVLRRVAGGGRRGLAGGADRDRVRHGGARADDTDRDHRRGWRFDRQRGCRRPAAGRSGIGRQQSRRPAMAGATHGPPSPTPMCCSAASRPTGRWAADCWRGWMPNARARPSTSTWAGRWAWTRRRRPRPSSRWPTPRWPARSAWCRSSAATIRASSPTCPSVAAARCTSAR